MSAILTFPGGGMMERKRDTEREEEQRKKHKVFEDNCGHNVRGAIDTFLTVTFWEITFVPEEYLSSL